MISLTRSILAGLVQFNSMFFNPAVAVNPLGLGTPANPGVISPVAEIVE